jgi:hypothetical protein
MQRRLIRAGAKNMRREFGGQVRKKLGGDRRERQDVWDTATTEPPPGEYGDAPECAWCPVCQAARRIRESGPGLGSQLSGAGEAVAAAVQAALGAFDGILSRTGLGPGPDRPHQAPRSDQTGPAARTATERGAAAQPSAAPEPERGTAAPDPDPIWSAAADGPAGSRDDGPAGSRDEGPGHGPDRRG